MKEAHLRSLLSFLQEDKVPNAWERAPKQMWREEWVNEQRNELMEHGIYSWTWRTRSLQVFFLAIKHEITTIHLLGAGAKPWRGGNLVTTQRNCKIGPWIYKLLLKTDFLPRCDAHVARRHRQEGSRYATVYQIQQSFKNGRNGPCTRLKPFSMRLNPVNLISRL